MGATRRLPKATRTALATATRRQLYVEFSYTEATLAFCTNSLRGTCALKKTNAAEDGYAEVRRIQQFLWFRFSKGTNVELKLRSTLQQSAGLVVF